MLTLTAILLAIFVLPAPWNVLAVVAAGVIDVAETVVFVRWSKRRRAAVGVETLIGRTAVVVRPLLPRGQVKLDGELWEARSQTPLLTGADVIVTDLDGLVLEVEPSK